MNIYFRLDTGRHVGDGHLFRCKNIAETFALKGIKSTFITSPHNFFEKDKFSPFEVLFLKPKVSLEFQIEDDAFETLNIVSLREKNPILIVDHYKLDSNWEKLLSENGVKVIAIDDLHRAHYADIIIDQNLAANKILYKNNSHKENTIFMIGPNFSLVRDEFHQRENQSFKSTEKFPLIFLGTADASTYIKLLNVIRQFNFKQLTILAPGVDKTNLNLLTNEVFINFTNSLSDLYLNSSIVFGACGVSQIERMSLGVRSIVSTIVSNQVPFGEIIQLQDLAPYLGDIMSTPSEILYTKIQHFLNLKDEEWNKYISKSKVIICPNGAEKIVNQILKII